ncbi:MAG: hypothetical protein SVS15_04525 [Thermodesulfobacteriota bacterium]|nr:hypothetical protein [Thermodesulfobacteriota bacterium]
MKESIRGLELKKTRKKNAGKMARTSISGRFKKCRFLVGAGLKPAPTGPMTALMVCGFCRGDRPVARVLARLQYFFVFLVLNQGGFLC